MSKRWTKESFIEKIKEIHGNNTYDFSLMEFTKIRDNVKLVCNNCNHIFEVSAYNLINIHRYKYCPKCNANIMNKHKDNYYDDLMILLKDKYQDKYDGILVPKIVPKLGTKVKLICKSCHNIFEKSFDSLKNKKHKNGLCPHCESYNNRMSESIFWTKLKEIHEDYYDYSKVEYKGLDQKITLICNHCHKEFETLAINALNTNPKYCPHCKPNNKTWWHEDFMKHFTDKHLDRLYIPLTEYQGSHTKMTMQCKECGHIWEVKPYKMLNRGDGCPMCAASHMEREVRDHLVDKGISYVYQMKFDWLGNLELDFYIPIYNVGIECQGLQHFDYVNFKGNELPDDEKQLKYRKKLDRMKRNLCKKNGIKIYYYADYDYDFPYNVYRNIDEMIDDIIKENS